MTAFPAAPSGPVSVYTGRVTNWPMVISTSVAMVPLVFFTSNGRFDRIVAAVAALAGIGVVANLLTASSLRTTAGPNGVTVHWGVVGWPRVHYPAAEIERADVFDLPYRRVSWGFWWTPRRTNCTVRSGPTLRLRLTSGRTVTVSVPDPAAAVAALPTSAGGS